MIDSINSSQNTRRKLHACHHPQVWASVNDPRLTGSLHDFHKGRSSLLMSSVYSTPYSSTTLCIGGLQQSAQRMLPMSHNANYPKEARSADSGG